MTDHEQEKFEAQLRQLKPGKLPEELVARIEATVSPSPKSPLTTAKQSVSLFQVLRWLIPATAALVVIAAIVHRQQDSGEPGLANPESPESSVAAAPLKQDSVQIGKEQESSFDAVATLPGGEPVRFRGQQWVNTVVVDDTKRGLLMQSRTPRVIVVPVGLETY